MNYQDFQILIDKNNNIRASSSQGEVAGELQWDRNQIRLSLKLIDSRQTNIELLKALGSQLYQALFPDKINARFHATIAAAQVQKESVRLRLIFESSELAALPWEFLYDKNTNIFLANNTQTVLSRYINVPLQKRDIKSANLPLKVLLVVSTPTNLAKLDVAGEEKLIREALGKHIEAGNIELDVLQEATIRNINQKLREKSYDVFHFIGHGVFENNQGFIALEDNNGKSKLLDDESFANFFLGNSNVGLVVLNSCQGAAVGSNQVFAGTAPNLVRRGIPSVVAMQYSILDSTAKLFADEFYRTLALGYPIDKAIQTTRNAISMEVGLDKRDFATPVLYMQAKDGIILDIKKKELLITPKNQDSIANFKTNERQFPALDCIPVFGYEASEVEANYTRLQDLLKEKKFGLADLETVNKILWVANRENEGWLSGNCIKNFPSKDLITIDKLWLSASKGKYGFSVQKQLWIDSGGKPDWKNIEDLKNNWDIFERFIERVRWDKSENILLDQRAATGHLPLGLYANNKKGEKIYHQWRRRVDKEAEEERKSLEEKLTKFQQERELQQVNSRLDKLLNWLGEINSNVKKADVAGSSPFKEVPEEILDALGIISKERTSELWSWMVETRSGGLQEIERRYSVFTLLFSRTIL